jgi:hypothetical protein
VLEGGRKSDCAMRWTKQVGTIGIFVGDDHKGPLNNRGKPTYLRKKQNANEPKTRVRQTHRPTVQVAPTAHQTVDPATLGRNSASLEGHSTALTNLRLARGMVAPSGEVPPRSRAGRPPRARSRLARGLDAPSSEVLPRSRTSWAHRCRTCSPDRGI